MTIDYPEEETKRWPAKDNWATLRGGWKGGAKSGIGRPSALFYIRSTWGVTVASTDDPVTRGREARLDNYGNVSDYTITLSILAFGSSTPRLPSPRRHFISQALAAHSPAFVSDQRGP